MTRQILDQSRNCWGIEAVTDSGVIVDGENYYRAFPEAAREAKDFILIAGWQFDSDVALLRGDDASNEDASVRFLPFLNSLCRKTLGLRIYILAWDYSVLYTLERESFQKQWDREAFPRTFFGPASGIE